MVIFESESDLLQTIDKYDALVYACISGEIDFSAFRDEYNSFYWRYALDGHESDDEERALFEKYEGRIEPHRIIAYEILAQLCSDKDANLESYQNAGRFGSAEALKRLKEVQPGGGG